MFGLTKMVGNIAGKYIDGKNKSLDLKGKALDTTAEYIKGEVNGNWLQRSWRPLLMMSGVAIIINNYIIVPYAIAFGFNIPILDMPPELWQLLAAGVGVFGAGRSIEKISKRKLLANPLVKSSGVKKKRIVPHPTTIRNKK